MQRFLFLILFIIAYKGECEAQPLPSFPSLCVHGVNIQTGQVEESQADLQYESYQEGENQLAEEVLFLTSGDFRIGKVKTIHCPSSRSSSQNIYFFYETGRTKIHENAERASIYHYAHGRLSAIEDYQNGLMTVYQYDASKHCTAILRGYQNEWISRCFYSYDNQGFMVCAISDNGQGQHLEDLTGVTHRQIMCLQIGQEDPVIGKPLKVENFYWEPQFDSAEGELVYEVNFHYDAQGQLMSTEDSSGEMTFKTTALQNENNNAQLDVWSVDLTESISWDEFWKNAVDTFFSCFQYLQFSAHQTKVKWNTELQLPGPMAQSLEEMGKMLLGEPTYLLMGPHFEETQVDCYGQHEVNDKVRITFINGILNTRNTLFGSLNTLSKAHGNSKIHYVFRPTEGWTWDISRAVTIKTAFKLGFRSLHAHLLAKLWKELIAEMGGLNGGGVIIHYAHSIGGSETDRARELLTPEEQKMIRVITFGSSTLIRNVGFQSVTNIVSVNDGVSGFFLEPIGNMRHYFDPNINIQFRGSRFQAPYWPLDHLLDNPIYSGAIQEFGKKFVEEFASSKEK